jgi:hypothetical protein
MRDELNRIKKEHDLNKPIVICSNDLLKMIKNRLYRGTSIGNHRMYGINTANEICREQDWLVHSVCVQNYSEKLYLFSNNNLSKGEMKLFWSNNKNIINKRTPPWELIYEKQD